MSPVLRKRGCPKSHEITVIGLPAKKCKHAGTCTIYYITHKS